MYEMHKAFPKLLIQFEVMGHNIVFEFIADCV